MTADIRPPGEFLATAAFPGPELAYHYDHLWGFY
jgi:hypothetical protein